MVKNKDFPDSAAHPQFYLSLLRMPFILRVPLDPAEAGPWQSRPPTESKRLFNTSVSLLLSHIQNYRYHLSKCHIYMH